MEIFYGFEATKFKIFTYVTRTSHLHSIGNKFSGLKVQYTIIPEKENLVGHIFLLMTSLAHICLVWIRHGFGVPDVTKMDPTPWTYPYILFFHFFCDIFSFYFFGNYFIQAYFSWCCFSQHHSHVCISALISCFFFLLSFVCHLLVHHYALPLCLNRQHTIIPEI